MRAVRWMQQKLSRPPAAGGYSVVELIIAVGMAIIVGLGIYAVFNSASRSSQSQKLYNDVQTSCTFAIDQMKTELTLAGYRATDPLRPINPASGTEVTFVYRDDHARNEGPFAAGVDENTKIRYYVASADEPAYGIKTKDLVREYRRATTGTSNYDTFTKQVLAKNIQDLSFAYFKDDNSPWALGGDTKEIRMVRVSLKCEAGRKDPISGNAPQVTVTTEVRARNVGIASVPKDTSPPDTPADGATDATRLLVADPGVCGRLDLRWPANQDADLEGYIIFYGLAPGSYTNRISLSRPPQAAGAFETYSLTGLASTKYADIHPAPGTPVKYYIALAAIDKSGNVSPELSIEASGNPSPDTRTISTFANNDTTINPDVPPAPTVQAIAETPADNVLKLNWSPSTTVVGLTGYRVYRGTTATFVPDGTELTGNKIAELGPGDVTYTDDGHDLPAGKLTGCTPYYYKIAAIACDTTLPVSLMNFATITGTATDATPPSSPILVARPGFKRIILSLNNPVRTGPGAEPDFAYSKIWFNKNTAVPANPIYYPKIDALGAITDGTIVPDSFPYNPATPGTFTKDGTMVVNFNDENDGNPGNTVPNLHYGDAEHPMTYYFLSVAYDQCGNRSLVTSNAVSQGTECFDCLPGDNAPYLDCSEAPPAPANVQASGCFGNLTVSWNAMPEDYRDFAGFHLFRCEGATCATGGIELTGGDPLWFTTFTDTSSGATPILPGVQYSYRVEAADCYYERRGTASDAEKALNNPFDNVSSTTINNVSIGQIDRDTTLPWLVTGYLRASTTDRPFTTVGGTDLTRIPPTFLHNAVTVWLKNSANTTLTLRQLAASWENPLAYLQKVGVGDGNQTPMEIAWQDTAPTLTQGSTGSSVNLSTTSPVTALDDKIPFVTVFKTANGQVNSTVDMRQETLRYTLYFRNDSTNTEGCGVTGYLTVPLGPYLYGVTQDQPSAGTNAWPVPGEQGGNSMNVVTVPGGTKVNVFANVKDTTGVGISAMKVFYYVDTSKGLFTPPPLAAAADYPNALSPWTEIHMLKIAGETWGLRAGFTDRRIPVNDNANVWYFVVAEDAAGNFDREPEVGGGAFQYFQQSGNFCSSIPSPPAITGTSNEGAQSVTLSWTVPSFNATPALSAYTDPAGYHVWRSVDGGSFGATPYADIPSTALNPTTITWTDPETLTGIATSAYSYYVTSYDQCLPPKESVPSNVYTDSVEYPCSSVPQAPALTGSTPGDSSVELVWQVPDQNTSSSSYGDPGGFTIWRNVNDAGWGSAPYASIASTAVWPASITWVDPDTGIDSNTLKNNMYAYKVQAYDNCPSTGTPPGPRVSADSNVYTESQTANACSTVPGAPTGVTVTGADGTGVSLSWTKPPVNVNGTPYGDPGGYYVYRCEVPAAATGCTPAEPPIGTTTVTTYKDIVANAGAVRYGYTVKAYDACTAPGPNVGDFSSPVVYETYTDPCMTTPATPTLLEVTAQSGTGVTLGWTAPTANTDGTALTDLAGYNVYRCQGLGCVPAPPKINVMTVTGTSYTDPVTDAGAKAYYYSVAAVDQCTPTALESARFSPPVPETFADPCSPSPTTPSWTSAPTLAVLVQASDGTALACNGVDSNKARLSWPSATATVGTDIQYEVYRCDSGKSNTACVLSADNQSSNPSFFTTAGAISSRTTKVTTLPAGTLTYTDIPGKAMKVSTSGAATVITYLVRAVNKSCSTQTPQPFYNSIIVAPCP